MLSPTMQFLMLVDKRDQKVVLESSAFIVWACRIYGWIYSMVGFLIAKYILFIP